VRRRDAHDVRLPLRQRDALDEEAVGRPFKSVGMPPGERERERRKSETYDFNVGKDERGGRNSEAASATCATERALELSMLDGIDRIAIRMLPGIGDRIVRMRMGMLCSRMHMMVMRVRIRIRQYTLRKTLMGRAAKDHRRRGRNAQRNRHCEQQNDQQVQCTTAHGKV
jgi:hypothetical protein